MFYMFKQFKYYCCMPPRQIKELFSIFFGCINKNHLDNEAIRLTLCLYSLQLVVLELNGTKSFKNVMYLRS